MKHYHPIIRLNCLVSLTYLLFITKIEAMWVDIIIKFYCIFWNDLLQLKASKIKMREDNLI